MTAVRGLLALALAGLGACTGTFQRALPDRPAEFARSSAGDELLVGTAERDITPEGEVWLAGFDLARASRGVASRLKVRAMVFALGDHRVAVVGVDNLGLLREDVDWIKAGIAGFANGNVFVCASHTHAGPDLVGLWGFYFLTSGREHAYLAQVRRATAEAVAEAWSVAAPAWLRRAEAMMPPKGMAKNANRGGLFDRRVTVLHATARDDGRPLGTLLHLACHPEVLPRRNQLISADFVGDLCDTWRALGLGQAVFCNGALGSLVSPDVQPRTQEGAHAMGTALAEMCRQSLALAVPVPTTEMEVRRRDVFVPIRTLGLTFARLVGVVPRELHQGHARSTVGWLRIGTFEAIAVPGEMEPVLAQRIRDLSGRPDLIVLGLCDDELGYLMRLQDARDPEYAYERSMSPCLDAGERIAEALLR